MAIHTRPTSTKVAWLTAMRLLDALERYGSRWEWASLHSGLALGMFVGVAMGAAGAQARSMFSMLIPETRTSEFFGFFGFLGKSAAMIGTFLYALASTQFDSRVAILTITIVILMGTFLTSRIDLEEGMRVAAEEDRLARENPDYMNAQND